MRRSKGDRPQHPEHPDVEHRYAFEGRAEFGRIYLASLTSSAEHAAVAHGGSLRARLRRRSARRRVAELRTYQAARQRPLTGLDFHPPRVALAAVSLGWIAAAVGLGVTETAGVRLEVRSAANLTLQVVSLLWFVVAILCVPTIARTAGRPAAPEKD